MKRAALSQGGIVLLAILLIPGVDVGNPRPKHSIHGAAVDGAYR
jgi:hypothetical protein